MNQTILINTGVNIDNAIANIKRGNLDLAIQYLENAKDILSAEDMESEAVLNNFSQAVDFIPKGDVVNSEMIAEHGHERFQFES